jgi:DNA polymerase III delta subunit
VIVVLCGENDFELTKKVAQLKAEFAGLAERYDGADLTAERLADIFAGQTLFSLKRLVIIDSPSNSADLWQNMPTWAERLSSDTELVLVEPKPDKRTSVYKWLQKNADVQQFDLLDDRNISAIANWATDYASQHGIKLSTQQARRLAERGGTDQWSIAHAIDKLKLAGEVTDQWIDNVLEPSVSENVFALFETALNGQGKEVQAMLESLRQTEDAYRVFGLISAQAIQLVSLIHGEGNASKVAADSGAKSAYPFQKLAPYAARLNKRQAARLIELLAGADTRLKSSDADPWTVLESSLVQIASLVTE